ncbi:C40 family peptidase [Salegentibacter sp. JZCK2]|uniref:C40 family peptidase n=1 Tax=Salegentibacter tibetensis TaxID=2873600 RepID=UPI001CC9942D|nr:C40 family peptidase [Salegentibacter tibetensis]MBZ9729638.1 C40 family peptidase [Salegentibacter tibetensis]
MQYGICPLSIVPLRETTSNNSEMVSQVLYGEHFKILEERAQWSRIRVAFDNFEAWISNKQLLKIPEETYFRLDEAIPNYSADLFDFVTDQNGHLITVPIGAALNATGLLNHQFEGHSVSGEKLKVEIVKTALLYLNSPYSWGGKSPLGIDCSGLTQMVYKLNGYQLNRNSADQAKQGEALSFIEESEAGDLAFFDDKDGVIDHVGIMMNDNYIIHVDGKVRIDRIDHSGIFNAELKRHTHQLRVIKKII